jgi:toxin HigB-1
VIEHLTNAGKRPLTLSNEIAAGNRVKAFSGFERSARVKLDRIEAATSLRDLAALQWQICFERDDRLPGPSDVEIVDYH